MGLGLNPFFWLTCFAFLLAAAITAPISGVIAYFFCRPLAKTFKTTPKKIGVPVAVGASLTMFFVAFCGLWEIVSPFTPPSPWLKPAKEDIVGIWEISDDSKRFMQDEGGYEITSHTLEFTDTGNFTMTNMLDWWRNGWGFSNEQYDSGRGIWEIETDWNGDWAVGVQFTNLNGEGKSLRTHFHLMGRNRPYEIYV